MLTALGPLPPAYSARLALDKETQTQVSTQVQQLFWSCRDHSGHHGDFLEPDIGSREQWCWHHDPRADAKEIHLRRTTWRRCCKQKKGSLSAFAIHFGTHLQQVCSVQIYEVFFKQSMKAEMVCCQKTKWSSAWVQGFLWAFGARSFGCFCWRDLVGWPNNLFQCGWHGGGQGLPSILQTLNVWNVQSWSV